MIPTPEQQLLGNIIFFATIGTIVLLTIILFNNTTIEDRLETAYLFKCPDREVLIGNYYLDDGLYGYNWNNVRKYIRKVDCTRQTIKSETPIEYYEKMKKK